MKFLSIVGLLPLLFSTLNAYAWSPAPSVSAFAGFYLSDQHGIEPRADASLPATFSVQAVSDKMWLIHYDDFCSFDLTVEVGSTGPTLIHEDVNCQSSLTRSPLSDAPVSDEALSFYAAVGLGAAKDNSGKRSYPWFYRVFEGDSVWFQSGSCFYGIEVSLSADRSRIGVSYLEGACPAKTFNGGADRDYSGHPVPHPCYARARVHK